MESNRYYHLDRLRGIAIIFVMMWHFQPLRFSYTENAALLARIPSYICSLWYWQFTLVAVPLFYVVSLLLYFEKLRSDARYTRKRLRRLMEVFLFWSIIQLAVYLSVKTRFPSIMPPLELNIRSIIEFIVMGGPPLPWVGDSVLYFIFDLLVLTGLAHYYSRMATAKIDIFLIALANVYFLTLSICHSYIPYWRIDGFLVYIPLTHLLSEVRSTRLSLVLIALAFFGIFIWSDFLTVFYKYNLYGRNSIFWGVVSMFLLSLKFGNNIKSGLLMVCSRYSLGLFAVHKYWQFFSILTLNYVMSMNHMNGVITFGSVSVSLFDIIVCISALLLSASSLFLMKQSGFLIRYIQ